MVSRNFVVATLLLYPCRIQGFSPTQIVSRPALLGRTIQKEGGEESSNLVLLMAKKRKAQKRQNYAKQGKARPDKFYEAINEAAGKEKPKEDPPVAEGKKGDEERTEDEARRKAAEEAQKRMEERPDVSTMIVDESTGIEIVRQGKNVMDVVTRKAVKLSDLGPEYRLAQMFPGVPPDVRENYRFDWNKAEVPQMVEQLRDACSVKMDDGTTGIPPHPSVANKAIDFVTANRDLLGYRMKKTLGRLTMRSMSQEKEDEAKEYQKLWKHFLLLENHISAPFRQMIMDGEGRVGPNFGNLDLVSYCQGPLYERTANYLVLKSMVANWEKKVRDAEYVEKTPQTKENYVSILGRGDPKRYLPDPPILFTLEECTQVCVMSQQMCKAFVETPQLYNDLPPEVRFLEQALTIKGGTALRQYIVDDFCPKEGIAAPALREGMRRLYQQLANMQLDPYGDITNIISRLIDAMSVGTDDERDPYEPYIGNLDPNGPGKFQTYTFNHDKLSLVRFLDNQYTRAEAEAKGGVAIDLGGGPAGAALPGAELPDLGSFFGFGGSTPKEDDLSDIGYDPYFNQPEEEDYKVPELRSMGRPHELGWLDQYNRNEEGAEKFGQVKAGRIIPDGE